MDSLQNYILHILTFDGDYPKRNISLPQISKCGLFDICILNIALGVCLSFICWLLLIHIVHFILVRVEGNAKKIFRNTMDMIILADPTTDVFLGGGRKPDSLEETHADTGWTSGRDSAETHYFFFKLDGEIII